MNRLIILICTVLGSSVAFAADGVLGTKSDTVSPLQGPSASGGSLLQMVIAVLVVFGLMKYFLPKMMAKFGGKLNPGIGSSIKIEESASFQGGTLYLVTVKDRSLLLGVSGTNLSTLADLGTVSKPDPGPTFMEILDVADESKAFNTEPIVEAENAREVSMGYAVVEQGTIEQGTVESGSQAKDALQRLQKLIG
jgi:flagellar biogenesis protein FliO